MASRIGKYMVERELGRGGFGKVYLAFDPDVGQPVAIKKLLADGDLDLLKRFQMEIRTTAGLRHKNIVTIHASGEEDGDPYLVMEFLEGQTLKQIIQERKPLSLLDKVRIMTQVAEGLAYAHSKGVVHRDVKPENIMLLPDDNVKIMDFGIALGPNRNTAVTQTGGIIGTPAYFAPEQLAGLKASQQTDIFSYGDVYYELLTGVHPFEQYKNDWKTLQIAIMSYEPRALGDLMPGCPEALETMVHRTLAKEPEFRYQRFDEVQLDSEAILVDLKHEGASAILREVAALDGPENLQTALSKINQAYQLAPGNREVRRRRDELNLLVQKEQVRGRVTKLLAEADSHIGERRYAEAVQSLETAAKLDSTNVVVRARLDDATARRDGYVRATRLISEARYRQQKGLLAEAEDLLTEALSIEPDHTEAMRLSRRVREELERRKRQQAVQTAREHLAARRFAEALAVLGEAEDPPGATDLAELRAAIHQAQSAEDHRARTERFHLAVAKTLETMQAGDLDRAAQMVDRLAAHFASDPEAPEVLRGMRKRLEALSRIKDIARQQQRVQGLLEQKSYREALDVLGEALRKFPADTGLERLNKSTAELYRAQQRSEAIAAVLNEAGARREAGDLQAALAGIAKGRQTLGDEAAFVNLARELEAEIGKRAYRAALDSLLQQGRDLLAAGKYSEIARLDARGEFGGEADLRALRESARVAAAIEEEQRSVEALLSTASQLQSQEKWTQALAAVEQGLARYPQNANLARIAQPLRERVALEKRNASIERHRTAIRQEIQGGDWKRAEAALQKARAELPGDSAFDDLAAQAGLEQRNASLDRHRTSIRQEIQRGEWKRAEAALQKARAEFPGDSAFDDLAAQAVSEQRRASIERHRTSIRQEIQAGEWTRAEAALQTARAEFPGESAFDELAALAALEQRRSSIQRHSISIRQEIKGGHWKRAEAAVQKARAEFPDERVFEELAGQVQSGSYEAGWQELESGVNQHLAANAVPLAAALLEDQASRARYAADPRWAVLSEAVAKRQGYEEALREAERQRLAGNLSEAENVLTEVLKQGPPDKRATQMRGAIQAQRSEILRQQAIASTAEGIRERLKRDDLAQAGSELAAARSRYPGESVWSELQAGVDARQQAIRRRAASIEAHRKAILREIQGGQWKIAEAAIQKARAEFPEERAFEELAAQAAVEERLAKIEAHRTAVRKEIHGSQWKRAEATLQKARAEFPAERVFEELAGQVQSGLFEAGWRELESGVKKHLAASAVPLAAALLEDPASRAIYAADPRWVPLAETVAKRQGYEEALREAERQRLAGHLSEAENVLGEVLKKGPLDQRAVQMRGAIQAQKSETLRQQAIARMADSIRERLKQNDLAQAGSELAAARTRYPGESVWDQLQADVDTRQQAIRRRAASIEGHRKAILREIQGGQWKSAAAAIQKARAEFPEERVFEELAGQAASAERLAKIEAHRTAILKEIQGGQWKRAEAAIQKARAEFPEERTFEELAGQAATAERLAKIETHRTVIRQEIQGGQWERAEAAIQKARAEFPEEPVFEELAAQAKSGSYEAGWRELESGVNQHLAASAIPQAAALLEDKASRASYAGDPRWAALAEAVARRQEYEEALLEAEQQRLAGHLSEAEKVLTEVLKLGPLDQRAGQMRGAIQAQLSETMRQQAITRIAEGIREHLKHNDLAPAESELAAARSRYPGESAWDELQADVDARQQAIRSRAASIEAHRGAILREIQGGQWKRAEAAIKKARAEFPEERVFEDLAGQAESEERLAKIQAHRGAILREIQGGQWKRAEAAIKKARAEFPEERTFEELAGQAKSEERLAKIEAHRSAILPDIQGGQWKRAEAAIQKARAEFPEERLFEELAGQAKSGSYQAGWRELESGVNQHLAANDVPQAAALLEDQASRAIYAADPRWARLAEAVARRRDYEEALREAESQRLAGQLEEADNLLAEILKQAPPDQRASQMRAAIQAQLSETLRQQAITRIAEEIREHLKLDDLAQADLTWIGSELAEARTRYPGESVWDELQADVDARLRKADIAAAVASVQQSLDRGGVRHAIVALNAARAKYPAEAAWARLEAEIDARQASLDRLYEIGLAGESIHRWLLRAHPAAAPDGGSLRSRCEAILRPRRDDLQPAQAELDAARAKYPGEPRWENLQAEIVARREFLEAETAGAEGICQCLEEGRIPEAQTQLAAARAKYPDDDFWGMIQTEIGRLEELRKTQAEIARMAGEVRGHLDRESLGPAAAQLTAAKKKYPQETAWAALQTELEERQAAFDRKAAIAAAAETIRQRLERGIRDARAAEAKAPTGTYPIKPVWDVLRDAAARLEAARAQYPDESIWDVLAAEITQRQMQIELEIEEIVWTCADISALDWNEKQLAAARTRYPEEPFWEIAQARIDARREALDRASLADFEARIGECLSREDYQAALVRLGAARKRHPGAPLWDQLQGQIDAVQRRLKLREDLDALELSVGEQLQRVTEIPREKDRPNPLVLQWEAFGKAAALLAAARAKYPAEDGVAVLASETGSRRAQWQSELALSVRNSIRDRPPKETANRFGPQLRTLREREPAEPLWASLEAELQALEALLKRQHDVAAAGERIREVLQKGDIRQATGLLDAARKNFSGEQLWSKLQAEIDARLAEMEEARSRAEALLAEGRPADAIALVERRFGHESSFAELLVRARAALEEERRRHARGQAHDRLLAIEQQIGTGIAKRKRKELEDEAQRLIAGYATDAELAAIAARIHALVEPSAPAVEKAAAAPKAIPYKPIGIGVGAAAALGVILMVSLHKKPPEPAGNTAAATIPVEIRTEPSGAALRIGDHTCADNCKLDLAPGTYEVDAQLKGFLPKHQTFVVDSSNRLVDLKLDPVPAPGSAAAQTARIEISGAPANVELSVDGKTMGRTDGSSPFSLTVKPGDHGLEVTPGTVQLGNNPANRRLRQKFEGGQTVRLTWKSSAAPGTEGNSGSISVPGITPAPKSTAGGGTTSSGTTPTAGTPPPAPPAAATNAAVKEDPEQKDWDKVRDTSSPAQLRDFRSKYGNGKHAKEAEDALERLVWSNANNLDSLRAYLQEFPNGAHRRDALSRVDDLTWKAVDQKDTAALQKFVKENPGNPHRDEAQKILDQIQNAKQDAEKQRTKLETDKKAVLAAVGQFNAAFEHGNKRELSAVWPSASKIYLDAVDTSHRSAVKLDAPTNLEIAGDTATLLCNVVSGGRSPGAPVKITLQRRGDGWIIASLSQAR